MAKILKPSCLAFYLIAFLAIINSSACSRTTPPGEITSPTTSNSSAGEDVTITFASHEDERGFYETLMEAFHEENPDINIQFVGLPEIQADPSTNTNFIPTFATVADTGLLWRSRSLYNDTGYYFRDLRPLIESDSSFDPGDFWPNLLSACENIDGSILGIPLAVQLTGIFYDPQPFETSGLAHPEPGWTVNDFQQIVSSLSRQEGNIIRYGFADRNNLSGSILAPFIDSHLITTSGDIDAEPLAQEIKWYLDLADTKDLFPIREEEDRELEYDQWVKLFEQNRPVMWIGGLGDPIPGVIQPSSSIDPLAGLAIEEIGFVPFPVSNDNSIANTTPAIVRCGVMSAGTTHPREAWRWLDFLSKQWLIQDNPWAHEFLQVPARQSVADTVEYWNGLPPSAEPAVRFGLEHAWYGSFYPEKMQAIGEAIVQVVNGESALAVALGKPEPQTIVSTPTPESKPVTVATPKPTISPNAAVLDYFPGTYYPKELGIIKALSDEFNQTHPDIFVNMLTDRSSPSGRDWLSFLAGKYSCFTWYSPFWRSQKSDELLSINSLIDAEDPQFIRDYNPLLFEAYRLDGTIYGLPAVSQPLVIAYNADLLAKRGLENPSPGWTFNDFLDLATSAASTVESDKSYGYVYDKWETFFLAGRGIEWADLTVEPPVTYFDAQQMVGGLTWLADLRSSGVLLVRDIQNWDAVDRAVAAGRVAFWNSNAGQPEGWYFDNKQPSFNIGVVPMPSIDGSTNWINTGLERGHYISRHAENPQACWDWIKFLSEQSNGFLGVPARRSVAESSAWEVTVGSETANTYRLAVSQAASGVRGYQSDIGGPFYTWLGDALYAVIRGNDPQTVLVATQHKADNYLACMSTVDASRLTYDELQTEVNNCGRQVDPEGNWP